MVRFRNIGCRFMVGWGRRGIGCWSMIGFNFGGWWSVGCRSRAAKNGTSKWGMGRCRGMVRCRRGIGSRFMVWGWGVGSWGIGSWGRMGNIATVGVHIGGLVCISFRTGGIFTMFFIHTSFEN